MFKILNFVRLLFLCFLRFDPWHGSTFLRPYSFQMLIIFAFLDGSQFLLEQTSETYFCVIEQGLEVIIEFLAHSNDVSDWEMESFAICNGLYRKLSLQFLRTLKNFLYSFFKFQAWRNDANLAKIVSSFNFNKNNVFSNR